jgi:hypothetical protein
MMIFSQRYYRALQAQRFEVIIPGEARSKLKTCLIDFNMPVYVQRDPNNRWIDNSDVVDEAMAELKSEHGWDEIPNTIGNTSLHDGFRSLVVHGNGEWCSISSN